MHAHAEPNMQVDQLYARITELESRHKKDQVEFLKRLLYSDCK